MSENGVPQQMNLSTPQRGVLVRMALGLLLTLICFGTVVLLNFPVPNAAALASRSQLFALSALLPAAVLAAAIGRLAAHRFFTPHDLDGSGLTQGTDRAKLLQALLQNTLEQVAVAIPVYAAWVALAPERFLAVAPASAGLFVLGRVLFFWGYNRGAQGRALGFSLTFYPTVVLLVWTLAFAAWTVGS